MKQEGKEMKEVFILGYDEEFVRKMNSYNLMVDYKVEQQANANVPIQECEQYEIRYDGETIIRITNRLNDVCVWFHEKIHTLFSLKDINIDGIIEVLTSVQHKAKTMQETIKRLNLKPVSDRVE